MRRFASMVVIVLGACTGESATDGTMGDMSDMSPDTDDDTPAGCTTLTAGPWSASGSCFGHDMTTTLALEGDGCTFTLSDWSMAMGAAPPDGGRVAGSDVTFDGAEWTDCAGTTDGTSITGTCSDGCDFDFTSDG